MPIAKKPNSERPAVKILTDTKSNEKLFMDTMSTATDSNEWKEFDAVYIKQEVTIH